MCQSQKYEVSTIELLVLISLQLTKLSLFDLSILIMLNIAIKFDKYINEFKLDKIVAKHGEKIDFQNVLHI